MDELKLKYENIFKVAECSQDYIDYSIKGGLLNTVTGL